MKVLSPFGREEKLLLFTSSAMVAGRRVVHNLQYLYNDDVQVQVPRRWMHCQWGSNRWSRGLHVYSVMNRTPIERPRLLHLFL